VKLYLVRHGQSTGNVGGTLMGQSDHLLTPLGQDQARAAAARLAPFGPMPVYSSDLARARATAEHIAVTWEAGGRTGVPPKVLLDPRLREISLGEYEGRSWGEFEEDEALTAAFAADPYGTALPNGESLKHLETRVLAAVADILSHVGVAETAAQRGDAVGRRDASTTDCNAVGDVSAGAGGLPPVENAQSACLVAHDGPIRTILNHYLGVPLEKRWALSIAHGGVSMVEFVGGCVAICFVNATGHLAGIGWDTFAPDEPGGERPAGLR